MLRRSSSLPSSSLLRVASYSHAAFLDVLQSQLGEAKSAGTLKLERTITSPQERLIAVQGGTEKVTNFCANNYLGLSNHPALVKGAQEALKTHGFGLSSVRFICGTQDIHKELEKELARFHGTEDAILYGSCFDANGGVFEALLGPEDAIISDELNHASIIDGIRLCKAQRFRYSHRNMAELEKALQDSASCRTRYIVTDGVFSMDGTIAPLDEMARLADRYNALLMTDECHSTGFMGDSGKGIPELLNAKVDVISSTLGKALGGATGGYIAGPSPVVGILRQRSRPYLFSNSVAPCVVGASLEALKLVQSHEGAKLRQKLKENVAAFRSKMTKAGFTVGGDPRHPICPIHIGDAAAAQSAAAALLQRGIYVIGFSFPVVPKGKARIRVQVSAAHEPQDIDKAVEGFAAVGRQFKIIQ